MLNMDELHFVSSKRKAQFKLKAHVGPYIVNTIAIEREVDEILNHMKFKLSFTRYYDPLRIISTTRVEQNTKPDAHTPRPEIKQYANQEEWTENTLQEAEEKIFSQTSPQTPISKEKEVKRSLESMSPIDSGSQAVEFHVFKRKKKDPKKNTKTDTKSDTQVISIQEESSEEKG